MEKNWAILSLKDDKVLAEAETFKEILKLSKAIEEKHTISKILAPYAMIL